jgi:hypothetical protein
LAVFGTIAAVTVFYCLASLALVGMLDYRLIDSESGFSEAFRVRGFDFAHHVVASGEFCCAAVNDSNPLFSVVVGDGLSLWPQKFNAF